ncbi:MAG: chorismate--pyruvate lyase [Betaproteobacteria bacterium HGW-Betaproteobacteria-1]|jgi:chorismate--pyruvate lyase|nr:MAG: chorismate--pyruvate lyase [Betaproteobacteria bacterium HGW-Betaproteobacteria-1]
MNSGSYRHWLTGPGSLTRRLQSLSNDFQVRPSRHQYGRAQIDEAQLLGLSRRQNALLREVYLYSNGKPVVFAHSVLPCQSLRGEWLALGRLGNKPLGAALFMNPKVTRTQLEFKKLSNHHALYRRAVRHLAVKPQAVWARRSIFRLGHSAIMVTEVFLPQVLKLSEFAS